MAQARRQRNKHAAAEAASHHPTARPVQGCPLDSGGGTARAGVCMAWRHRWSSSPAKISPLHVVTTARLAM
jgi:hypothetical protein